MRRRALISGMSAGRPKCVNRHYRCTSGADHVRNESSVDVEGLDVNIHEHRDGAELHCNVRSRWEAERRHDDFIAWLNSECIEDQVKTGGCRACREGEVGADEASHKRLKSLSLGALREVAALENAGYGLCLVRSYLRDGELHAKCSRYQSTVTARSSSDRAGASQHRGDVRAFVVSAQWRRTSPGRSSVCTTGWTGLPRRARSRLTRSLIDVSTPVATLRTSTAAGL